MRWVFIGLGAGMLLFSTVSPVQPAGQIVLEEPFDSMPEDWEVLNGSWTAPNHTLEHVGSGGLPPDDPPDIILSPYTWSEGVQLKIDVDIKWNDRGFLEDGIVWGYRSDPQIGLEYEYNHACLTSWNNTACLSRFWLDGDGFQCETIVAPFSPSRNVWYDSTLILDEMGVPSFYVDGQLLLQDTGQSLPLSSSGYVGLGCWKGQYGQYVEFDNFTISQIPEPSTLAGLISLGIVGLIGYWWRRRKA